MYYSYHYNEIAISDSVPKILVGFQKNYFSSDSQTYYGRRFEWGTFYHTNLPETWHAHLSTGFCTLDEGFGYCGLVYLVVSSITTSNETGYDIRGGRYVENGTVSVVMSWGVETTTPGFTDTVVASWDRVGLPSANLHFMIQPIEGAFHFSDICEYIYAPLMKVQVYLECYRTRLLLTNLHISNAGLLKCKVQLIVKCTFGIKFLKNFSKIYTMYIV